MGERYPGLDVARQWRLHRWRLVRLLALAGLVGLVVGVLFAAGILGSGGGETVTVREGGETRTVVVDPARLLATTAPPGMAVAAVGPEVGRLAPDFEFSDMEGKRRRLSDFRGRPVMLNFWATWCTPCRREMPDIQKLLQRHQAEGLVVVAMNRGERLSQARAFLEELGVDFTVEGMDPSQAVYQAYLAFPIELMPISVFIDKDGVIRGYHPGLATLTQMEELYAQTVRP